MSKRKRKKEGNRPPRRKRAPKLRGFSWWSIERAEDMDLIYPLTADDVGARERRDAFAKLIWAHLEDLDPEHVEAEIEAGNVDAGVRKMKLNAASILSIPELPRLIQEFSDLLADKRLEGLIETGRKIEEEEEREAEVAAEEDAPDPDLESDASRSSEE